jgi:hypothetical protein
MTSPTLRLCLGAVGLIAAVAQAQPTPTSPAPAIPTTKSESSEARPTPKRRNLSPELAAALTAGVKYEAPPAEQKKEEVMEEAEETDLRDTDRPRNTIIRLPKYVIEGERPPVFSERDINTQKGLADLAIKRYLSSAHLSLNRYHLPAFLGGISSEELAMMMYRDQERLKNMQETADKVYLYRQTGDNNAADELKETSYSTFLRKSEFTEAPRANGK